ncbi:MAG: hypothetical protein EA398_15080, partial [Deltaproteobacteria bacterium]
MLACEGDLGEAARNACGRCGPLPGDPGDICGTCLVWTCSAAGALRCEPTADLPDCPFVETCATLGCQA